MKLFLEVFNKPLEALNKPLEGSNTYMGGWPLNGFTTGPGA